MNKFKVGDSIRYFDSRHGYKRGKVHTLSGSGDLLGVFKDDDSTFHWFHYKQCRRLVKKPRREFWIIKFPPEGQLDERVTYRRVNSEEPPYPESLNYIHVREVVEKK